YGSLSCSKAKRRGNPPLYGSLLGGGGDEDPLRVGGFRLPPRHGRRRWRRRGADTKGCDGADAEGPWKTSCAAYAGAEEFELPDRAPSVNHGILNL
ncbi:unnamed protein product, partial [Urochloa humidicola]